MFISDIDAIVEDHDSAYINGEKNMFASGRFDDDDEEEEDEQDDIEVEYTDSDGVLWYMYLTASEKAHWDALTPAERIEYAEQLD